MVLLPVPFDLCCEIHKARGLIRSDHREGPNVVEPVLTGAVPVLRCYRQCILLLREQAIESEAHLQRLPGIDGAEVVPLSASCSCRKHRCPVDCAPVGRPRDILTRRRKRATHFHLDAFAAVECRGRLPAAVA